MTEREGTEGFTEAEAAYFQSGGQTELPAEETASVEQRTTLVEQEAETQAGDAPAAEEGQAEQQPEGDAEQQARDEKGRFVPHGAFHEERTRRKEAEDRERQLQERMAVLEDRWNTVLKLQGGDQQAETQEEAPPDPEKDIFAYTKWQAEKIARLEQQFTERQKTEEQTRQQQTEQQALIQELNQSFTTYSQEKPDANDAANFLVEGRKREFMALGYSEQQAQQAIAQEALQIAMLARQAGRPAAQIAYELATARGYTPQQAQQGANEAEQRLANVGKAQEASRTLAGTPGKGAGDPLSPQAIADMSPQEFDAWVAKPENQARFNRMLAGR